MIKCKLNRPLYSDPDCGYVTDSCNMIKTNKGYINEYPLWAKTGEIFYKKELTEEVIEEYNIDMSSDPKFVYVHQKENKWFITYDEIDWFNYL